MRLEGGAQPIDRRHLQVEGRVRVGQFPGRDELGAGNVAAVVVGPFADLEDDERRLRRLLSGQPGRGDHDRVERDERGGHHRGRASCRQSIRQRRRRRSVGERRRDSASRWRFYAAATWATVFSHEAQERADRLLEVRLGRVLFLAVREPVRRIREHHHDRHVRHHLGRVVQRARRQLRRVAGLLAHRLVAQRDQLRVERPRVDAPEVASTRRATLFSARARSDASRASRSIFASTLGVERALVERDLADAGHRGHDLRLDVDDADRAHDAGAGPASARRAISRHASAVSRGGEKRVAPHRNRRRARNAPPGP